MSPTTSPLITRPFLLVVAAHFLQGFGYASMLLLPLYLAHLGASRAQIGTIMALAAANVIFRPIVGWSLDVLGRKTTLFAGTILLSAGMGLFYFVVDLGPLVYVIRLLIGVGIGALFTGYFTFASDQIPASRRTEGIALFGVSGLSSLVINPFIGELGVEAGELRYLFPIVGVLVLSSLLPLAGVPEPARSSSSRISWGAVVRALRERSLVPVWFAIIILGGLVSIFMAFATVTAEHRAISHPKMLWLTYAFGAAFVRIAGGKLPDRIGPAKLVPPSFLSYALAMLLASHATTATGFLAAGFFAGVGHGFGFPIFTSQVVTRSPEHLRGSALAMLTALWELSALALTPLFGAIADAHDDATMFGVAAIVGVTSLVLWAPLEWKLAR